jgi:hypothetical protein
VRKKFSYKKQTLHGHPRADVQGHVALHVLAAVNALGRPLPAKAVIHHVDENTNNLANGNLVICEDQAFHKLLHVRAKVVRAGGNPNAEKYCSDCERCKPFDQFNQMRGNKSTGLQSICRDCQWRRWTEWKRRRQSAV